MKILKFLIFFVSFYLIFVSSLEDYKECLKYWKENLTHPIFCCNYPHLTETSETFKCYTECENSENKVCCNLECFNRKLKLVVDDKFNKKEIIDHMLTVVDKNQEDWRKVIEKNYEKCIADVEAISDWSLVVPELNGTCNTAISLYFLEQCLMRNNFLDCVSFSKYTGCEMVKNYVETLEECNFTYENIKIIFQQFWYNWNV
ncbi:hypothetical protein PVAND_015176 [Polypedilum vanderplanki]|uniref:Uncharacterized protein n=1 Tax=Polypedilum vanderplanki TaxID=319348 RepID=A0A9J6BBV3_POLVA|nr:hypothetical protein PVAND_015176 [Polypedilum vanderplanki]